MKALIVGMGFGNLYKDIYESMGWTIATVDADPAKAEYRTVSEAAKACGRFTTAHICTPNFTHYQLALDAIPVSDIVFVEKPGVRYTTEWGSLCRSAKMYKSHLMMVKNNMWRYDINAWADLAKDAHSIHIKWVNKNRIPHPGSWFTTRSKAFGGVSRDLMPHLLSIYRAINPSYSTDSIGMILCHQFNTLDEIESTEYGEIHRDGIFDVDDMCQFEFVSKIDGKQWFLMADWNAGINESEITFYFDDCERGKSMPLGLCPEYAYQEMINDALDHKNVEAWWDKQYEIDMWILHRLELL